MPGIKPLVWVPAIITLAVTLLRLVGELMDWSPLFFNAEAGGGGALIGIVWLVPILGIYFAVKLAGSGQAAGVGAGRVIGLSLLALVLSMGIAMGVFALLGQTSVAGLLVFAAVSLAMTLLVRLAWPEIFSTLLNYGLSARIPVAIIMLVAILGDWQTHYDLPPPDFPAMSPLPKWIVIGLIPQLTIWVAFTIIVGGLFAGLTLLFVRRTLRAP
jgi:hypothetical protein